MRTIALLVFLVTAFSAPGCSKESAADAPTVPPDASYTVRGIVKDLPSGGQGPIVIEHEAISDFRDNEGKVVGMHAMAMPFAAAPGLPLEGIAKGDKVRFRFDVRWKQEPRLQITSIEKLPPDTAIDVGSHHGH